MKRIPGIAAIAPAVLALMMFSGCRREAEETATTPPARLPVEGAERKIFDLVQQGRLCLRIYGTALAVARPMCEELVRTSPKVPALLEYYNGLMKLENGELDAARKDFQALADSESAPSDTREMARMWAAACELAANRKFTALLALGKPSPSQNPRLASEAGRIRAFLRTDLAAAEQLCAEALKAAANRADLQALNLNYAIVLLQQGKADDAQKALDAVNPQAPIDECEIEKIKLPKRELMRTLRLYDPVLLKCRAEWHFLKAVELGADAGGLEVARALVYLGRSQEAERRLQAILDAPTTNPRDRAAALALSGQALWARSDKSAARKRWAGTAPPADDDAVFLLDAYAETPGLPADVLDEAIQQGQAVLKRLRQKEAEYSERRFREKHLDLFWALGRLCCVAALERVSAGDTARAAEYLADAEEIGNRLYDESSRFDLDRNAPLFLAELADVWLLNVLTLGKGNAYLEDVLRYMYDPRMLPSVLPAAWQVREQVQLLYALRDLSAGADAVAGTPAAPPRSMYRGLAAAHPDARGTGPHPQRDGAPSVWRTLAAGGGLLVLIAAVAFFLLNRRMRATRPTAKPDGPPGAAPPMVRPK